MRRGAFTLIEVMAVVALLALAAGAVTWSFADEVRRSSKTTALNQIMRADCMARLAGQRLGRPCVLRFDLARQRVFRVVKGEEYAEDSHAVRLSSGCRVDRVTVADESAGDATATRVASADSGVVDVAYSTSGRSVTYAVRLTRKDWSGWLVFAGLTGQVTLIEHEDEIQNLFSLLASGRVDAH
jgi:prepilin-type N-terminal cleavage/methylation domain-containing protein